MKTITDIISETKSLNKVVSIEDIFNICIEAVVKNTGVSKLKYTPKTLDTLVSVLENIDGVSQNSDNETSIYIIKYSSVQNGKYLALLFRYKKHDIIVSEVSCGIYDENKDLKYVDKFSIDDVKFLKVINAVIKTKASFDEILKKSKYSVKRFVESFFNDLSSIVGLNEALNINEYLDNLGNDFDLGDWIEFDSSGLTIMAEITDTNGDKYTVKPIGFRHDPKLSNDEVEKLKSSLKNSYSLNVKRKVYKLTKPKGKENYRIFK